MRTDVLEIEKFYASPLGQTTSGFISARLHQAWGTAKNLRVAGFGYTSPYMHVFSEAERRINLAPEAMGAAINRHEANVTTCLTMDLLWPLPDASMDRIIMMHGLEETQLPRKLIREAWRVLADDGLLIIAVPNRRGPWAMFETTPFAAGRPYLRGQLDRLLRGVMFTPSAWSSALYFPPIDRRFLLRASNAWERAGGKLWPGFAGVTLVEARKELALPVSGSKVDVLRPRVLKPLRPRMRSDIRTRSSSGKDTAHNIAHEDISG